MAAGPHKGLRISADFTFHMSPAEEAADVASAETCAWDSVFASKPARLTWSLILVICLQRWAAKVGRFCNIWYVGSAASEGRTGATWEPRGPEASSIPVEQAKNKLP